ncbi:hypothetical protein Tco_0911682 [Tanacetum coccineum]|uniref:Uncharacterized protein n=1 Tax=Tanacetum coccineum TaxID=301880 RepID=A0ABQ5CXZ5_9ASTR
MKIAVLTVDFLGAVIGEGTIKLQPHIIKKIVNFNEEELKTKKGLRSHRKKKENSSKLLLTMEEVLQSPNAFQKNMKTTCEEVMAISIISVSSDSSEDSVGIPAGRIILFDTIPTTIPDTIPSVIPPTTHIDTTPIPIVSPTIPPLPATSPFLSSTDDSSDSDIPDTPPSPTYDTPFTETTLSTQRSPVASSALRRRVMILLPGQPIPHG